MEFEPERSACVVTCQKVLSIHMARDFLDIAAPDERVVAITFAFDNSPSCETKCEGQTEVDNSAMCEIGYLDTALSATSHCSSLSSDDPFNPAISEESIAHGRCLFDAADQFLNCQGDCNN